eukprot:NODE_539_length_6273_cov_0.700194.p1 type:complete len:487 gc:universal NODE_539_length_6273_cov_0.700194:3901-2441(-)
MIFEVIQAIILIVVTYFIYVIISYKLEEYQQRRTVPFVKPDYSNWIMDFFLGNTKTLNFQKDPTIFSKWRKDCKSDIFGYRMTIMPRIMVYDKELITLIGTSKFTADFIKPIESKIILKTIAKGILMQEGASHAKSRNAFLPVFSIENLKSMHGIMTSYSFKLVEKLKNASNMSDYSICGDIQDCTLDIISKIAFDYEMNALEGGSKVSKSIEYLLIFNEFDLLMLLKLTFPALEYFISFFESRFQRELKSVHNCIDSVIKERVATNSKKNDLLSRCIDSVNGHPSKEMFVELRDQIFTFMAAGYETTSTGLSWAVYCLATHPEIQTKLRKSLSHIKDFTWDEIHKVPYLEHVCNEVLRLYTPAPNVNRETTKAFTYKDYYFPKGTTFLIQLQGLHVDGDYYDEPLKFIPERWESRQSNDPYDFLPFWTGFRGCIGKNLALAEFKTILAIFVSHFEFSLANTEHVERVMRITQKPTNLQVSLKYLK